MSLKFRSLVGVAAIFILASARMAAENAVGTLAGIVRSRVPAGSLAPSIALAAAEFPLEVHWPEGSIKSVTFLTPANAAGMTIRTYNASFQGIGSVRLKRPDGTYTPWVELNNKNITLRSRGNHKKEVFGLGGIFQTRSFIMKQLPVFPGQLVSVEFRFDRTNFITSGYKVLDVNFIDAAGKALIENTLTSTNYEALPKKFDDPTLIAAGKTAWFTQTLLEGPGLGRIKAHCTSCHFTDGSDLKYFGFSAESIASRAAFHGFTAVEQDGLIAYIKHLPTPRRGNPWDPPFQPGPGLDAKPIDAWMAGAGVEAVLDDPEAILPSTLGSDVPSVSAFDYRTTLNVREVPLPFELPDWISWLPIVHPDDLWADSDHRELIAPYLEQMEAAMASGAGDRPLFVANAAAGSAKYVLSIWFPKVLNTVSQLNQGIDPYGLSNNPIRFRAFFDVNKLMVVKFFSAAQKHPESAFLSGSVRQFPEAIHHAIFFRVAPFEAMNGLGRLHFRDLATATAPNLLNLQWWTLMLQGREAGVGEYRWNYVSTSFPMVNADLEASAVLPLYFKKMVEEVRVDKAYRLRQIPIERIFTYGAGMYFSSHASLLNAMVGGVYQNYAAFGGAAAMLKEGDTSSSEDPDGYTARNAFRSLLRTFGKTASPHVITGLATGQQAQLNAIYAETWHDSTK